MQFILLGCFPRCQYVCWIAKQDCIANGSSNVEHIRMRAINNRGQSGQDTCCVFKYVYTLRIYRIRIHTCFIYIYIYIIMYCCTWEVVGMLQSWVESFNTKLKKIEMPICFSKLPRNKRETVSTLSRVP